MIDCNELGFIKDKIFGLTGFDFVGEITVKSFDGVKVDFDGKNAVIGCKNKTTLARALFLLSINASGGAISLEQKARFETLGVMLECSRNGVMRPEKVKKYIVLLNYVSALTLLAGLMMRVLLPEVYSIVYLSGAIVFAITFFFSFSLALYAVTIALTSVAFIILIYLFLSLGSFLPSFCIYYSTLCAVCQ